MEAFILLCLCYCKCPVGSWGLCLYLWPPYASEDQDMCLTSPGPLILARARAMPASQLLLQQISHSAWPWLSTFDISGQCVLCLSWSGARASSDMCAPHACLKKVFPTWRSCVSDWVTVFDVCKMSRDISASCPEIAWNPGVYISAFLLIHSGIIKQLLNLLELWFLIWTMR